MVDELQAQAQIPPAHHGVAYIYFNYIEQDQQKPADVLASLVKQLTCQVRHLPPKIGGMYDELKRLQKRPSLEELYTMLQVVTKSFGRTFIVCDALDECNQETQRKKLLPLFHRMEKDGINLFITSREYPEDIQHSFQGSAKIKLWAKDEDIASYIGQKISEDPRAKRLVQQGNCKDMIISQLKECANGM